MNRVMMHRVMMMNRARTSSNSGDGQGEADGADRSTARKFSAVQCSSALKASKDGDGVHANSSRCCVLLTPDRVRANKT
jgi:hypothetical protein